MSFLGLANFYHEFIKGYADKVYTLQKMIRKRKEVRIERKSAGSLRDNKARTVPGACDRQAHREGHVRSRP